MFKQGLESKVQQFFRGQSDQTVWLTLRHGTLQDSDDAILPCLRLSG